MKGKKYSKKNNRRRMKKGGDYNSYSSPPEINSYPTNNISNKEYIQNSELDEQSEQFFPPYARYSIYQKELESINKQNDECCDIYGKNIKVKQYMFFSKNKCPKFNCDMSDDREKTLNNNINKIKEYQTFIRNRNRTIASEEDAIKAIEEIKKETGNERFKTLDQELQNIWNNRNNPIINIEPAKKGFFSSFFTRKNVGGKRTKRTRKNKNKSKRKYRK